MLGALLRVFFASRQREYDKRRNRLSMEEETAVLRSRIVLRRKSTRVRNSLARLHVEYLLTSKGKRDEINLNTIVDA